MHLPVLLVPAAAPGPQIGGRGALTAVAVLLICVLLARLARPILRFRHARLVGATPEQALLQAGLGHQPPPAQQDTPEPVVAITVLPSKQDIAPVELELGEQDLALVETLGDHPMSAPGRHRTVSGWLAGAAPTSSQDAETLLSPPPVQEPTVVQGTVELVGYRESDDDRPADRDGSGESPVSLTTSDESLTDSETMNGATDVSRAGEFYGVDWHDEDWQGVDLTGRSGRSGRSGDGDGDDGASGEWWASAPEVAPEPVAEPDVEPLVPPTDERFAEPMVELDLAPSEVAFDEVPFEPAALVEPDDAATWWESVAEADLPIPLAAEYAEDGDYQDAEFDGPTGVVPGPREAGQLTAAQLDALRSAQGRLHAAEDRIAVAKIVTEEAWVLAGADSVALVVPTPDGPRALALHPASVETWGPQTLAALVSVSEPLRAVLDGDPLADGSATSVLATPITGAGARIGALVARRVTPRAFSAVEESLIDRLARIAGVALDGLTRRGALRREEGAADPATDLAPQPRLVADLQAALRTHHEHGMPLSLMVAEVEGLPRMRTEVSPEAADDAMARVANTITDRLRVGDIPYRFADDVIAVLLAGTDTGDAAAVAQRLTGLVDDTIGEHVAQVHELAQPLRLRAAVVAVAGSADEVMAEADRALTAQRVQARWA